MASREDREQIRCSNTACPSRRGGGQPRIVVERGTRTGWYYKKLGKASTGAELEMVSAFPVMIPCGSCGQHWLNPGLPLMDGLTTILDEAAEQMRANPPTLRGGLRGVEAA